MKWSQEEMNEAYRKVQKMAMTDEEFRAELLKDSKAAIEKVSGKELPEGFQVKLIEEDPAYAATFVLPDFIGEAVEDGDLDAVAGGISLLVGSSACGAAISIGPCAADACGAAVNLK